jgi:hypothetical protein
MSVAGNWVNNGSFSNNSGTVNFNGNTTPSPARGHPFPQRHHLRQPGLRRP